MLAVSLPSLNKAQIINTRPVDVTVGPLTFDPKVVSENKIKIIHVSIWEKPDGDIMQNKGEELLYRFNREGLIRRLTQVIPPPISKKNPSNTTSAPQNIDTYVFYGPKNRIITKRVKQLGMFHSYNFEYNGNGNIQKQYHCKETNISPDTYTFKLGEQTILTYDIFEYKPLSITQIKKSFLNDELEVYKTSIINYDSLKNKISEVAEYVISSKRTEDYFTYDSLNHLTSHTYISNEFGDIQKKTIYTYDEKGNLLTEVKTINGILCNKIEYLYDSNKVLLKSQINHDHLNSLMIIKKYSYTFFN